jgi:hypothetical protein
VVDYEELLVRNLLSRNFYNGKLYYVYPSPKENDVINLDEPGTICMTHGSCGKFINKFGLILKWI